MRKKYKAVLFVKFLPIFIFTMLLCSCKKVENAEPPKKDTQNVNKVSASEIKKDEVYATYVDFFKEVFDTMQANYYEPVTQEDFERFLNNFDTKIFPKLKEENKSNDYIRWRSAAFLIDFLKTDEDIFSAFYPPEPAKEYQKEALDVRMDLGIEGQLIEQGYQTTQVEPRADAYEKGLRIGDIILRIGGADIKGLTADEIKGLLTPVMGTKTDLEFVAKADNKVKVITVEPKEYFKQSVFPLEIPVQGIYGIRIEHFNRKTGEDVLRFMQFFREHGPIKGFVIDLRSNPGGPPLAARELASFFLPGGTDFAYFQRRGQEKAMLDVPSIPEELKFDGPMVILVDKKSGSASELFSGVLQRRGRAVLMGTNSAGQVMLKSMFHFKDGSMALLITSRGYDDKGVPFSFDGLTPDRAIAEEEMPDILKYAALYLVYMNKN
jgi:C-terminal peptidase prc